MKILQIHNQYQYKGGEDTVFDNECTMLVNHGHHVIRLVASNDSISNIIKSRKEFYEELNHILANEKVDIAHIHNVYHIIGNRIYTLLNEVNIPIVQTLHNFRFLCPAGLFLDNQNNICEKCIHGNFIPCFQKKCYQNSYLKSLGMLVLAKDGRKKVQKCVNQFIALNSFSKSKFVEAGFQGEKISIKSNFLTTSKDYIQSSHDFFLYVGRLSTEKGIETLINTFIDLDYPLKIAGSGIDSYVDSLKELTKKNNKIEFVGYVSGQEKEELVQNAISLIIPSNCYENFPMSILEAYSFKKPVIASNIGGLPSIVKDGETGLLFEAGNSEALKNAVHKMVEDDRFIELGNNGYEYYQENFTEKQNYRQLMEIYESAIAAKKLKNDTSTNN